MNFVRELSHCIINHGIKICGSDIQDLAFIKAKDYRFAVVLVSFNTDQRCKLLLG